MDLAKNIELLIKVQALDTRAYELNRLKGEKPRVLEEFRQAVQLEKDSLVRAKEDLTAIQLKRKDKELQLQKKEEEVKKFQTQLYQIKSNKEYKALVGQIEGLKADDSVLEEEIIVFFDEIDKANKEISEAEDNLKKEEAKLKEAEETLKKEISQIDSELDKLRGEKEKITSNIDKIILGKYEHILKNKNGLAMTKLVNGVCQGCNMNVPPQVINEVKMKEELMICENCSRILYIIE